MDGTRVRAGGKWLTCIGNKNVRVGNFVQTDGRCVYGHEIDSSTPLVITAKNEDEVIPIQFGNSFGYFSNRIERIGELPFDCKSIVNNKRKIAFTSFNSSEASIVNYEYKSFWSHILVLSANCDKQNDVFELVSSAENYINITRNGEVIKSIQLPENEVVIWGFIEDANNWAYVSYTTNHSEIPSQALLDMFWENAATLRKWAEERGDAVYPLEVYYYEVRYNNLDTYRGDYESVTYNGKMTFYDSHGTKKDFISFACNYSRNVLGENDYLAFFGADIFNYNTMDYSGMHDIKFPLQDGFYFTLDEPTFFYRDAIGFPTVTKKNIFAPDDKIILSDYFEIQTNFAVCKSQPNNYLIVPVTPDTSGISTSVYTLGDTVALTKPEYDPSRRNWSAFLGTVDTTPTMDENVLVERFTRAEHNSRNVLLVNTKSGTVETQDWKHLGYNLRKMSKEKLKKWLKEKLSG